MRTLQKLYVLENRDQVQRNYWIENPEDEQLYFYEDLDGVPDIDPLGKLTVELFSRDFTNGSLT